LRDSLLNDDGDDRDDIGADDYDDDGGDNDENNDGNNDDDDVDDVDDNEDDDHHDHDYIDDTIECKHTTSFAILTLLLATFTAFPALSITPPLALLTPINIHIRIYIYNRALQIQAFMFINQHHIYLHM
jgi:hypothetical protein